MPALNVGFGGEGQVGGPRGWIIVDLDAESAETGPSQLRTEELEGAHDAALLDLRELPVELDAAHPECVSFLRQAHAAVRIGNLLDPRREPDSLERQAARDLPEPGCRKIAEHERQGGLDLTRVRPSSDLIDDLRQRDGLPGSGLLARATADHPEGRGHWDVGAALERFCQLPSGRLESHR